MNMNFCQENHMISSDIPVLWLLNLLYLEGTGGSQQGPGYSGGIPNIL